MVKYNSKLKIFLLVFLSILVTSCYSLKTGGISKSLLDVVVKGSQIINHEIYNKRLASMPATTDGGNLYQVLSEIWFIENARSSVISIKKVEHDYKNTYAATVIYDNVPDDDSVSGYRFDITIKGKSNNTWELTEVKESWRCWKDRGHREFSVAPCS